MLHPKNNSYRAHLGEASELVLVDGTFECDAECIPCWLFRRLKVSKIENFLNGDSLISFVPTRPNISRNVMTSIKPAK